MANSVLTLTVRDSWAGAGRQHVVGTLAIAAGDYPAGGLTLSWKNSQIKSSKDPVYVRFSGIKGYVYQWDRAAGKIRVFQGDNTNVAAAPGIEMATTTHANVVADTTDFYAIFKQLI